MMSISQISGAGAASSYYQADNYYAKESDAGGGVWHGEGAQSLELNGKAVTPEEFIKILSGDMPNGQKLYRVINGEKKHIAGFDMTFSAQKSLSVLTEIFGQTELSEAHDNAVLSTLNWVEKNALKTRKWNNETKSQDEVGDQKMIAALFKHDVSRNEDPQLHTHCVVANAVQGEDGKFRSLHSPELFHNKMLIGMIYRAELAKNINNQHLAKIIRTHPDGRFELAGVSSELIKEFSSRSKEIEEYLGEGTHSAEDKAKAALHTRGKKTESDRSTLKDEWRRQTKDLGFTQSMVEESVRSAMDSMFIATRGRLIPPDALGNATEILSENSSTFTRRDLLKTTLSEGIGHLRVGDADNEIQTAIDSGQLLESLDKNLLFTPETLQRERTTLELEKVGRLSVDPILKRSDVAKTYAGHNLSEGQHNAASLILTSVNRTIGVQGYAGTGKTFMLASVAKQASKEGYSILGLAPTSTATKTLRQDAGIDGQTLQKFLLEPSGNHKTVLIVDEASMVTTKQMLNLLSIAEKRGLAKVVLVGDSKQLEGVGAGAPFKMLQGEGMRYAVMDEIKRQTKERHLDAVVSASKGEISRAFQKLGNDISEVPLADLSKETAAAWLNSANRETAAVVVTTNDMAVSVNGHIKAALQDEGKITGSGLNVTSLKSLRLTEAQKRYADNYRNADVVRFNRSYASLGVLAGDNLPITQVRDDGVIELERNGKPVEFKPARDARADGAVEAFSAKPMTLHVGDSVRWTRKEHATQIDNMDRGRVAAINDKNVSFQMQDGRQIEFKKDHPHISFLNHAWAQTGHAYQGQTIDHVIVAMPSLSGLTDQKGFYTDISRAKHDVTFLTDDIARIKDTLIARTGDQKTALDLVREKDAVRDTDTRKPEPIQQQRTAEKTRDRGFER